MSLSNLDSNSDSSDWDSKWVDIFDRYQRDLRHAHYVRSLLLSNEGKVLELGAGSFRDMAALRRMGIDCDGMDFSAESVTRAKKAFPQFSDRIYQMSGFDMDLEDDSYDVTFHNGFWVLFDDEKIGSLAREQARITKGRMFATVHNAHNVEFSNYFRKMKLTDSLYDIRFFTVAEITSLMSAVCDNVSVIPVGKNRRRHEDMMIKWGITQPMLIRGYLNAAGHRLLDTSERLLCIGTPKS